MNDTIVLGGDCSLELIQDGSANIFLPLKPATYTGAYEFTPTSEVQIIPTAAQMLEQNITINPVPNNYGLITWNGSTLTVS